MAELELHRDEQHVVRTFVARRTVERRRREVERAAATGETVVTTLPATLQRGLARRLDRWQRDLRLRLAAHRERRRAEQALCEPEVGPETGDMVVNYLQVGARNLGRRSDPRQIWLRPRSL